MAIDPAGGDLNARGRILALPRRALAAARFGWDLQRAAAGAWSAARPARSGAPAAGLAVHFLIEGDPTTDLSPAARYRAWQYVPLLETLGFACHVHPSRPGKYFSASAGFQRLHARCAPLAIGWAALQHWRQKHNRWRDLRRVAGDGVVFLQRDLLALPDATLESCLPLYNRHIVFDFDDAIFARPSWVPGNARVDAALRDKLSRICGLSTAVIAANEHLAEFARAHCARVHVVPTTLCTEEFRQRDQPPNNPRPVVGWIGTSGNLHYLRHIAPALRALAERVDYVLRVVCNRVDARALEGLPPGNLEFVEWRATGEVERIQELDVGIMPLLDDAWTRGKAGFKLVQYMACGVPFVASPVGTNVAVGGPDGHCGMYASDAGAWTEALTTLLCDAARRRTLASHGRARAVERFDRRVHVPAIARILTEAAHA